MPDCRHPKCSAPAFYTPTLTVHPRFRPSDYNAPPAEMKLGFEVCMIHKVMTRVPDLVTDAVWNQIVDVFRQAGRAEPGYDTLEIRWDPIERHALN